MTSQFEDMGVITIRPQKVQLYECKGYSIWPTTTTRRIFVTTANEQGILVKNELSDLLGRMISHNGGLTKIRLPFMLILILPSMCPLLQVP